MFVAVSRIALCPLSTQVTFSWVYSDQTYFASSTAAKYGHVTKLWTMKCMLEWYAKILGSFLKGKILI